MLCRCIRLCKESDIEKGSKKGYCFDLLLASLASLAFALALSFSGFLGGGAVTLEKWTMTITEALVKRELP